jgi:hypothetical protein
MKKGTKIFVVGMGIFCIYMAIILYCASCNENKADQNIDVTNKLDKLNTGTEPKTEAGRIEVIEDATAAKVEVIKDENATKAAIIKWQTITKDLTWLQRFIFGGIVLGAIVVIGGILLKNQWFIGIGIAVAGGCIFGWGLNNAGIYYPKWVSAGGLVLFYSICIGILYLIFLTLKRVILGGELFKKGADSTALVKFQVAQKTAQGSTANKTSMVERIVDKTRGKKEEIA